MGLQSPHLLLLLACLPAGLQSCLQCDEDFKKKLEKFRTEVMPGKIHDDRLKARAEVLLKGLEGNFFPHYATSQFSGFAAKSKVDPLIHNAKLSIDRLLQTRLTDSALLEELVEFRRKNTMKLKEVLLDHQRRACDAEMCARLIYKVIHCKRCKEYTASCLTISLCFVDSQERLSLRFQAPLKDPNIARTGVAVVLCMGGVLFLVIIGVILIYFRNVLFLYV